MLVRLGFSIAAHLDADVLLIDEVLAVGDEAFQRKCLRHIHARIEQRDDGRPRLARAGHDRARVPTGGRARQRPRRVRRPDRRRACSSTTGCSASRTPSRRRPAGPATAPSRLREVDAARRRRAVRGRCSSPASRCGWPLDLDAPAPVRPTSRVVHRGAPGRRPVRVPARSRPSRPRRGGGRLVFEIPRLTLLGGDYDIAIGVPRARRHARRASTGCSASAWPASRRLEGIADLRGTLVVQRRRGRGGAVKEPERGAGARPARRRGRGRRRPAGRRGAPWSLEDPAVVGAAARRVGDHRARAGRGLLDPALRPADHRRSSGCWSGCCASTSGR